MDRKPFLNHSFRLFALGLAMIIISIIAIQAVLQYSFSRTVDPVLINKSGRQRMISQRVTKLCLYTRYEITPESVSQFNVSDSLSKYCDILKEVHQELIAKNAKEVKSELIDSLLQAATPYVATLAGSVRLLEIDSQTAADSLLAGITDSEVVFLPIMERVTQLFEDKSNEELAYVKAADRILSIALALVVIALFVFVFFPILKRVNQQNAELNKFNQRLEAASKRLLSKRILLRTIIDNIPVNIYTKDLESRKTLANRSEWEYLGAKSEEEVLGKSDIDIYPKTSAEISMIEDKHVFEGNSIIAKETYNFKSTGESRWFMVSKVPLSDPEGTIVGLVGVSMDITAQKEATNKLQEALQEITELYDNAPCGYHTIAANGIITRMNKTELDWLGYTADEVVGKMHVNQLLTQASLNYRQEALKQLKKVGEIEDIDAEFLRKDGTVLQVVLNTVADFDKDGNFIQNRGTVFDSTDRRKLEQAINERNEKLRQMNEEKNRFLGMATHDLKSPLNNVTGLVSLLKMEDSLSPDLGRMVYMIGESVTRMKELISRLLDYSKIEQGEVKINIRALDFPAAVNAAVQSFEEHAKNKSITLKINNELASWMIDTDQNILHQIIDNLVSNAIKFSNRGTTVTVRTTKMGNHAVLEIIDQGPGIPAHEMPKLFQPFTQLSARPTAGETSSGLGMSIVKELVKMIGGDITVESEVGKGTTFRIAIRG